MLSNFINRHFYQFVLILFLFSCNKEDACRPASSANAGDDQTVIGTSVNLAANQPDAGIGTWTIVSGNDGVLTDPLSPSTVFTGVIGNTYVLNWSITGCPISEDEVTISFICDPSLTANAGP